MKRLFIHLALVAVPIVVALGISPLNCLAAGNIKGADDIEFGDPESKFDQWDYFGKGDLGYGVYYREEELKKDLPESTERTMVFLLPDKTVGGISQAWPKMAEAAEENGDQQSIVFWVYAMRELLAQQYGEDAITFESLDKKTGTGRMEMTDADGDVVILDWDGYDVVVMYSSAEMESLLEKNAAKGRVGVGS